MVEPQSPPETQVRKPAKAHTRLRLSLAIGLPVLALVAACLLFLPLAGQPILAIFSHQDTRVADITLEEIKDIYRLSTVEYLYRVVFPYDLCPPEVRESTILNKITANLGQKPATYLEAGELEYLRVLELAEKYHLRLKAPHWHFLVATVVIRAGFDLGNGPDDELVKSSMEHGQKTAVLTMPPATILDVRVEDPIRNEYPFPDVPLSPEGWKEISALLRDHALRLGLADGILDQARSNAQKFLESLLLNSGYGQVETRNSEEPGKIPLPDPVN